MSGAKGSGQSCRTVLVVEGNPDDTLLLQIAARETCPEVGFQFVQDGFQGLAYLRGEGSFADRQAHPFPDLLLLDVRAPGMDGFGVLEQIRQVRECEGVKVLAWNDGPDPRIGERAKAAGVEYFVTKPCSFTELMEEVRRVCELARRVVD